VARLGSSLVARSAVSSADSGQIPSQTVPQNTIAVPSQPTAAETDDSADRLVSRTRAYSLLSRRGD